MADNKNSTYPSDVPIGIPATKGEPVSNSLLGAILREIEKPVAKRLEEKTHPQNTRLEDNMCIYNGKQGVSINSTNAQFGGLGANITCIPDSSIIAMWSNDIQLCGNAKFIPNQPHHSVDLNFGPMNMSFAPPIEEKPRPTPKLAVVAVDTEDVGYSSIPTPSSENITCTISIADQLLVKEQSLKRQLDRQKEGLDSVREGLGTVLNRRDSDTKATEAELNSNIAVYVIIPDHVHTGPVGPVSAWITGNNCAAAVRGIKYEYLFGYNRMNDIISAKQLHLEKEAKI